jgi:hypothetical protein
MRAMEGQDDPTLAVISEVNNKRLDGFAASIKALTDQLIQHENVMKRGLETMEANLRYEFGEKIHNLEVRVNELQHTADSSKSRGEILELKISEVKEHANERSARDAEAFDRLLTEFQQIRGVTDLGARPKTSMSGSRPKKGLVKMHSASKKLRGPLKSMNDIQGGRVVTMTQIIDVKPRDGFMPANDLEMGRIQRDMRDLKAMIGNYQRMAGEMDAKILHQFKDLLRIDRERFASDINLANERIEECAKKSDLLEIRQFFRGLGDGEIDYTMQSRSRLAGYMSMGDVGRGGVRQISPHVKLISGENLKRPATSQYRR